MEGVGENSSTFTNAEQSAQRAGRAGGAAGGARDPQPALPQVAWIAERLAAQIAALRRETATWSLRSWDHASPTLSRWQRRRLQHQEYERRLLAMRDQRQRQLTQATSLDEQQRLAREVEVYSGRLARCRQALDKIENVLARLTR